MFNNTEYTTLEVKFTQSDLLEESKKRAIEAYDENNKCLGLIFNSGVVPYDENSDLDEDCIPEVKEINKAEEIHQLEINFKEALAALKRGELDRGIEIASNSGIYNNDHPSIAFLPNNRNSRREKLSQSGNLLPWTSADSITIFPL